MKNKLKFIVPVSAFLFAIAAAFASTTSEADSALAEPGYIFQDKICQIDGSCSNVGSQICTHNGMTLKRLVGNQCVVPLKGTWE